MVKIKNKKNKLKKSKFNIKMLDKTQKRNLLAILVIGFILIISTLYLSNELTTFVAGPPVPPPSRPSFYFTPSSGVADEGETFNVDLMVNTEEQNIVAVSTYIKYDPAKFNIQNIDTTGSVLNYEVENIINVTEGVIKITRGKPGDSVSNDSDDGFNGKGKIATISLLALSESSVGTKLEFIRNAVEVPGVTSCVIGGSVFTCVSRLILDDGNGTDILAAVSNASFTINARTSPSLKHNLSVTASSGDGAGRVTSSPSGIDCGAVCSKDFDEGTVIVLTATPEPSSAFGGWGGDAGCSDGMVAMDKAKSCRATFNAVVIPPDEYLLKIIKTGSGTVNSSPAGIDCGIDCSNSYAENTKIALTAKAGDNSQFDSWQGDNDCPDGVITMNSAKTCAAVFTPIIIPVPEHTKIRVKINLEGRSDGDQGVTFGIEVLDVVTGGVVKTYTDVVSSSDGIAEIITTNLSRGGYGMRLKASGRLPQVMRNLVLPDNNVEFTPVSKVIAGNLFDADKVINELDAGVMNRKWGTSDASSDINRDGVVNEIDWGYVNRNWGKSGE